MELKDAIRLRKSTRKYTAETIDKNILNQILDFAEGTKSLYDNILVKFKIVERSQVKSILPFITNYSVAVYSEIKDGYLENVGFRLQQIDLYLKTLGLGSCWIGMATPKDEYKTIDNLPYVILLTFGYPDGELLRKTDEFKRNTLKEISDTEDVRLEVARLAPSSVNSQPWYFKHVDVVIHAFLVNKGLIKVERVERMNRIDMGIALAHLYIEYQDTFQFEQIYNVEGVTSGIYIGSFRL
jgi:nitroreductase